MKKQAETRMIDPAIRRGQDSKHGGVLVPDFERFGARQWLK